MASVPQNLALHLVSLPFSFTQTEGAHRLPSFGGVDHLSQVSLRKAFSIPGNGGGEMAHFCLLQSQQYRFSSRLRRSKETEMKTKTSRESGEKPREPPFSAREAEPR